jgi:hypothetical protein
VKEAPADPSFTLAFETEIEKFRQFMQKSGE